MPRSLTRNDDGRRRRNLILSTTVGLSLLALCVPGLYQRAAQAATTYTVNTLGDGFDSNVLDGQCNDGGGNCSLRAAIQQGVNVGGVVTINFSVNGTINLTSPLPDISDDLTISGPGSSLLTVRRDTGGNYRIFTIAFGRNVSISGLTLTNGRTLDGAATNNGNFGNDGVHGGGIHSGANLTLTDVVVTGNRAGDGGPNGGGPGGVGGWGGGIFNVGTLTMTNVVISNNSAGNGGTGAAGGMGGWGGGLFSGFGTLTMTNVTISNNKSGNGGNVPGSDVGGGRGGDGGGIRMNSDFLNMSNVTVRDNATGDGGNGGNGGNGGGLLSNSSNQLTIVDSVFNNNSTGKGGGASGSGGHGGGIFNSGHLPLTLTRVTVSGNATGLAGSNDGSGGNGGGLYNSGALTILNSTVSGNSARGTAALGGGIYHGGNLLWLINSTVSGNQANPVNDGTGGRGGGLYNNGFATTITNATITGNTAYTCCAFQSGQGIHDSGGLTVRNTIIAGNGSGGTPDVTGTFNSHGNNLVGRATTGGSGGSNGDQTGFTNGQAGDIVGTIASPVDPRIGPLDDNGGPTLTHALLDGSPAIDAGRNSLAIDQNGVPLSTDQRGAGRYGGPGQVVDIGAFEFHPPDLEDITDKTTNEDTPLSITFNVGPVNVTSITATSSNQTLVPDAGLVLSGSGPIRTLQMTPAANRSGSAQITLTVTYEGGAVSSKSFELTVTPVNDAPSFTKGADQTVAEDAGPQTINGWASAISPGPNESAQSVSFLVTNNTNAALFASAPAVSPSGTLSFTAAPNASGSATLTLVAKDDGGTASGGQDTSAPQTFNVTVTPVNDPPVAQDQSVTTAEDTATNINLGATDTENNTLTFSITSNPAHGTLTGTGSSRTYTPTGNYNGPDSFTFKATDSAGADSQTATVSINVTAVNDAPVNTVPAAQATDLNTTLVFNAANFNVIEVADSDAGLDPLRVTLTVSNGTLTLGGTTGLTFTAGDGTDDATMTFAGTQNNINAAFGGLAFKPTAGFTGTASLQITTNDQGFNGSGGALSDTDFVNITVRPASIEFKQSSYLALEGSAALAVIVRRTGDTSQSASVAYATDDRSNPNVSVPCSATAGAALDRCDFTKALGRLAFAPGEAEKTIFVLIGDDSYVEGLETALINLSDVTGNGVVLGARASAVLAITDNVPEATTNPIDDSGRFVRQHYHDFLNREPDAPGLAFWTNEIEQCAADAQCREVKRINVSAAFFLSIEFQQTGYLAYRLDKVAFGDLPNKPVPLTLSEFLADTQAIGQGLVVGAEGWEERLEANKRSFVEAFVGRARFLGRYPTSTTPEQYIDSLNANAGGALLQEERDSLVADLRSGAKTRAQVLRAVAEHASVARRESNRAFVLMQYFGYLRRNPDDAPEQNRDFAGYDFWLSKLNEFNGDFIRAEMVKAFLTSDEYRKRFGQ